MVLAAELLAIHSCCDPSRHLQESLDPPGPKSQKSLKKSLFGGPQKSLKKYPKKSKKPKKVRKSVIFDFFGYFLRLFCGPPKRLFSRLFCDFGPGGSGDSCKWRLGSQHSSAIKIASERRCDFGALSIVQGRKKSIHNHSGKPPFSFSSAKSKRGRREGDGKKNVTTICDKRHDNLRHFTTTCDIL